MTDISQPEKDAGYETLTYPYHGNNGFARAISEVEKLFGKIDVLRVEQAWFGITVIYRKVTE